MKKERIQRMITGILIVAVFFGYRLYKDYQAEERGRTATIGSSQSESQSGNIEGVNSKSYGSKANNLEGFNSEEDITQEASADQTVSEQPKAEGTLSADVNGTSEDTSGQADNQQIAEPEPPKTEQLLLDFNEIRITRYKKSGDGIHTPYKIAMTISSKADRILSVAHRNFILRKDKDIADPTSLSGVTGETRILPNEDIQYDLLFDIKSESIYGYTLFFVDGNRLLPITVIEE